MTETLSLFDQPRARATDPATSHDAAARVAPIRDTLRKRILDALAVPMTDDELCFSLMVDVRRWPSVKTARSALKKAGLLVSTGEIRAHQTVWERVL